MTAYSSVCVFFFLIGQAPWDAARGGCRADVAWPCPGLDVVFAEEIAIVIEDELVVVGVAVEEWNAQRGRGLASSGRGRKLHTTAPSVTNRGVRARRKMGAMAHHGRMSRMLIFHAVRVALPAHYVDRIERIDHFRNLALSQDADFPLGVVIQYQRWFQGSDDGGWIVEGVLAQRVPSPVARIRAWTER